MKRHSGKLDANGWQQFVIANGFQARAYYLAAVLGQPVEEVERVRRTNACKRLKHGKCFAELFTLWHGRTPQDEEWPKPLKIGIGSSYEWLGPELVLLASLVGRLSTTEIVQTLTARLRQITGDKKAQRNRIAVNNRIHLLGMQSKDVLGGVTTAVAGREIGSLQIVNQALRNKQLRAQRVGRLLVIPYDEWEAWKSKRVFPPKGYVPLRAVREALSIKSDKLSEFARMGYLPTAIRCNPYGSKGPSTQFGTWYIDKKVADMLLADRRAGRPMPWHGKPNPDNLRATYKVWISRKHPSSCKTCLEIWGKEGAPKTQEDFALRYPPLAHGAKRHLTRKYSPGLTIKEVATFAERSVSVVRQAIMNGMLETSLEGRCQYISRTNATRWKARKCPTGENATSWITLKTASEQYLFTLKELRTFISALQLKSKTGADGDEHGVVYVSRHQCGQLREKLGFTEEQAARRVGVSVPRFRLLLEGVDWRISPKGNIPLVTVQAVIKRLESRNGYTIEEAAALLNVPVAWVHERKLDGTVKVTQAKWDRRRSYLTEPMIERLREALKNPVKRERFNDDWLRLSEAAHEAAVSSTTINTWAEKNELERRKSKSGWRYHREAVRARARAYWSSTKYHRDNRPDWLRAEQ
jgi:hypothetical protein